MPVILYGMRGTIIGKYLVRSADGETVEVPHVHGEDSRAWQIADDGVTGLARATIPWRGRAANGVAVRLFKSSWQNPWPQIAVESIDLHSGSTTAGPFLVAITTA